MPKVVKKKVTKKAAASTASKKPAKKAEISKEIDILSFLKTAEATAVKEAAQLTSQLEKLRAKHSKLLARQKASKDKRVQAAAKLKAKPSVAAQNQLNKAKDAYNAIAEQVSALSAEISAVRDSLSDKKTQKAKQSGLSKLIAKFEKDWAKKTQVKAKPAKRKTTAKKAVKKKVEAKTPAPEAEETLA